MEQRRGPMQDLQAQLLAAQQAKLQGLSNQQESRARLALQISAVVHSVRPQFLCLSCLELIIRLLVCCGSICKEGGEDQRVHPAAGLSKERLVQLLVTCKSVCKAEIKDLHFTDSL